MLSSRAMKAIVCKAWGGPDTLALEDLPSPRPGAGEVVIAVKAAGVNFPDLLIIQNKYQLKPPLPFTPGAELAGIVTEVGADVSRLKAGDPVVAMVNTGAFAEQCVASAARVLALPPGIDFAAAAAFSLTYGTAWHALKDRGQLVAGETLLVLGAAGGVGIAAIDIGKALGARVIAAASSDAKLAASPGPAASRASRASTWFSTRWAALTPRRRCAGPPGAVACSSLASPTARSPAYRSISRCSRAPRSSESSGAHGCSASPRRAGARCRRCWGCCGRGS